MMGEIMSYTEFENELELISEFKHTPNNIEDIKQLYCTCLKKHSV
jgi:hypothetical protein